MKTKFGTLGVMIGMVVLALVGLVFAGDGAKTGNLWQTISGFFLLITGGGATFIAKKIAIIKDLREMIIAATQVPAAIQIFAHNAPEALKSNPDYVIMLEKVDTATDEFADILAYNPKFAKHAEWLRSVITKDMYTKKVNQDAIIAKLNEKVPLTEIFDKAIADMTTK